MADPADAASEAVADAGTAQESVAAQHLSLKERRKAHPYHIELWGRLSQEERETIEQLLRLKKSKQGASWKQIPESTRSEVAAYIHYANGTFNGVLSDKDIELPADFNPHGKRGKAVIDIIKNHVEKIHQERLEKLGRGYNQSDYDRGGRQAKASINGDVVLEPLKLAGLAKIESHEEARSKVERGTFTNVSNDRVHVSNKAVRKWFSRSANELKRNLAPHLVEAYRQSVTYHKGEDGFSYAAGLIELDGKQVGVRFAIKQVGGKEGKLYQIEGVEVSPTYDGFLGGEYDRLRTRGTARGISVAEAVEVFNKLGEKTYPLFQARGGGRRGSIAFGQDGGAIINLFRGADLSTLLHESGHFFLNVMADMAAKGESSSIAEMAAVKSWWRANAAAVAKDGNKAVEGAGVDARDVEAWLDNGTTGVEAKDRAIDIGLNEQFARGFEAYLMEGKAPSEGLRAAFETFRSWLVAIYKRLASLDVKLSDEIRGVFDRMIATDEEIAGVKNDLEGVQAGVMVDAASLGLTAQEYEALLKKRTQAQDEAKARLLNKTMLPLKRAKEKWFKAERAKVRAEVEERINAEPRYRAFEWLANGRWLGMKQEQEAVRTKSEQGMNQEAVRAVRSNREVKKMIWGI